MKHLLLWAAIAGCLVVPLTVLAWDGFDAATTDLVEITPDRLPQFFKRSFWRITKCMHFLAGPDAFQIGLFLMRFNLNCRSST